MKHTPLSDDASRKAVRERLDVSMLVEAGAGSGKTTLMVERLLALIRHGVPINEIAAVTFTRKAANELRERFETQLERDAQTDANSRAALHGQERMFIGTIHAFCGRILREHAIEAGLSPGFEELDDVRDAVLRERFWRTFVINAQLEGNPLIVALDDAGVAPSQLYGVFAAFHAHRDAHFDAPVAPAPEHAAIASKLMALHRLCAPLRVRAGDATCGMFDLLSSLARAHDAASGWTRGAEVARTLRRLPREWDAKFLPITLFGRKDADKQPMKALESAYRGFLENDVLPWETQWAAHAYAPTIAFLQEANVRFAVERRLHARLTFDDLLIEAARLLREMPELRRSVGQRWTHLLIDEFQDTDAVQAEIALLIASPDERGDWKEATPLPGRLFLVGDPKQSIYRFRRADIATYDFVKSRIAQHGEVHQLTSNFRSAQAIADLVNAHFSTTFPAKTKRNGTEVMQAAFAPMIPAGLITLQTTGTIARYVVGPAGSDRTGETTREDARLLASWIATRIASGERRAEDFLVITSQRGRLQQYAGEFARQSIPVDVDGARHDTDAFLQELLIVLHAIADPGNPVRVVAALEGVMCGASHEELFAYRGRWDITTPPPAPDTPVAQALTQLHDWWRQAQSMPAASLIDLVADEMSLFPLMAGGDLGESRAGVLLHIIARVREEQGEASSVEGALLVIDELLRAEDTALPLRPHRGGALRLMNLHRAKGLEAKVVVLAAPIKDAEKDTTLIAWRAEDGRTHAALRVLDEECTIAAPLVWTALEADDALREQAERERLLYVATTRAVEELVVSQRRSYVSSSGSHDDESAWAPLAPLLEQSTPLVLESRVPAPRTEVEEDVDFESRLGAIRTQRSAAATESFRLATVTEASRRALYSSDDDDDTHVLTRQLRDDRGAQAGMQMGSAVHAVLEGALRGRRDKALNDYIDAVAWQVWGREGEDVLQEHRGRLHRLVAAAMQSDAWSTVATGATLPELPVAAMIAGDTPQLIEGVLDAITIADNDATIVDWKAAASVERFAALHDAYASQGAMYADIVKTRSGLQTRYLVQPVREA